MDRKRTSYGKRNTRTRKAERAIKQAIQGR